MRILREENSARLRASLRGLLPAVVTLVLLLVGGGVLRALLDTMVGEGSATGTLAGLFVQIPLYVILIGTAVWGATRLDRRAWTEFGLEVDGTWVRNFLAGTLISLVAFLSSVWWGEFRGLRTINLAADGFGGPGGPLVLGVAFVALAVFFLLGNVYEEVVYRGIMLQNFAEGLTARGFSPAWAVIPATVASLFLFGAYHVPLRGNLVVLVDSALVGSTFALAYLLTGELGFPIGIHFGRTPFNIAFGGEMFGIRMPAFVELTRDTLTANLEILLVHLGLTCLFILAWVYLIYGEIRLSEDVYRQNTTGPETG